MNAQEFHLIPKVGLNLANTTGEVDSKVRSGLNIGLGGDVMLTERFGIETGVYYSMQGSKYKGGGVSYTDKLDYINDGDDSTDTDLGCNGIWLMPIMPSPTYHKYDISDYENIDEQYGTIDDFKQLIEACHKRGIRVIIDFPINHTSSKHPWFTQAVEYLEGLSDGQQPDSSVCPYVDYYNFTTDQLSSVYYKAGSSNWYYEGKFWSEMPDLNLDCEAVRAEFDEITSFWMDLGVDGFRMDGAKEYFSDNTTENVEVLKWFNDMVKGFLVSFRFRTSFLRVQYVIGAGSHLLYKFFWWTNSLERFYFCHGN